MSVMNKVLGVGIIAAALVGLVGVVGAIQERGGEPSDGTAVVIDTSGIGALRHPDAATLQLWSEAAGVPAAFTYAVAWEETRNNADPSIRGAHGEYGRFQIKLTTARVRCPGLNVKEYYDNLACFLRMSREDWMRSGSWRTAARTHNGSGVRAESYANKVMGTVRMIVSAKVGVV